MTTTTLTPERRAILKKRAEEANIDYCGEWDALCPDDLLALLDLADRIELAEAQAIRKKMSDEYKPVDLDDVVSIARYLDSDYKNGDMGDLLYGTCDEITYLRARVEELEKAQAPPDAEERIARVVTTLICLLNEDDRFPQGENVKWIVGRKIALGNWGDSRYRACCDFVREVIYGKDDELPDPSEVNP